MVKTLGTSDDGGDDVSTQHIGRRAFDDHGRTRPGHHFGGVPSDHHDIGTDTSY